MKIPMYPGKYHQNGGFSMAMLVYRRVISLPCGGLSLNMRCKLWLLDIPRPVPGNPGRNGVVVFPDETFKGGCVKRRFAIPCKSKDH